MKGMKEITEDALRRLNEMLRIMRGEKDAQDRIPAGATNSGEPGGGQYSPGMAKHDQFDAAFGYHALDQPQQAFAQTVECSIKRAAQIVMELAPACPDRTVALRCLVEASMWAKKAISTGGVSLR